MRRPYTFIVMAMLILPATPFALRNIATDIFPEIDIPAISVIWNYNGLSAQEMGQRLLTSVFLVKALGGDWPGSGKVASRP